MAIGGTACAGDVLPLRMTHAVGTFMSNRRMKLCRDTSADGDIVHADDWIDANEIQRIIGATLIILR